MTKRWTSAITYKSLWSLLCERERQLKDSPPCLSNAGKRYEISRILKALEDHNNGICKFDKGVLVIDE